jgi:hypothetical protein
MDEGKLVICVFDQGVEPDVMEVLQALGISHWTRLGDAAGSGRMGTKLGNPIWPGLNAVLVLHIAEAKLEPLVRRLHEVRDSFPVTPGMRFIVSDATLM